jgi:hypothetical protein
MCAKIKLLLLFYTRIKSDPSLSEITLGSKFDQWANWSLPPVTSILSHLPFDDILKLLDMMLVSIEVKTHENYGAGLLSFHNIVTREKSQRAYACPHPTIS